MFLRDTKEDELIAHTSGLEMSQLWNVLITDSRRKVSLQLNEYETHISFN